MKHERLATFGAIVAEQPLLLLQVSMPVAAVLVRSEATSLVSSTLPSIAHAPSAHAANSPTIIRESMVPHFLEGSPFEPGK
ncbi:MAG: hypothetical protein ABIY55_32005 [Kofleriaceae bacterium]